MFIRILLIILSFFIMTIGLTYMIIYRNLFTFGYTLIDYFKFIITRYECWSFIIGFLMLTYFISKGDKIK